LRLRVATRFDDSTTFHSHRLQFGDFAPLGLPFHGCSPALHFDEIFRYR
jgi:hypothetical protein